MLSVARQMRPSQVAKRLSIGQRWVVNSNTQGVLPLLNCIYNDILHSDWEWAGEATVLPSSFDWRAEGKVTCLS